MSPVMDCQLVKVETCLSHSVLWDLLQPSVTLHRMSRYRNWMDGCLLFFVWRGSVTQLSATGIGTGRLKGNSLFYQSSQTSQKKMNWINWTELLWQSLNSNLPPGSYGFKLCAVCVMKCIECDCCRFCVFLSDRPPLIAILILFWKLRQRFASTLDIGISSQ